LRFKATDVFDYYKPSQCARRVMKKLRAGTLELVVATGRGGAGARHRASLARRELSECVDNVYTLCNPSISREGTMSTTATRTKVINLRTSDSQKSLIDRAAQAVGKDRTEFMLEAAIREAQSVLLDQRFFELDGAAFRKFAEALDEPPAANPRLRKLLAKRAPWEG
jgi:uncharacterized protein (DUF1778 family)